jgi:hypothetical protein
MTERRREERRGQDRRRTERRGVDRRTTIRRQEHELRSFLLRVKSDAKKMGHHLQKFEVVAAGSAVIVRSKCACGDWIRANVSSLSRESAGTALKKSCVSERPPKDKQLRLWDADRR